MWPLVHAHQTKPSSWSRRAHDTRVLRLHTSPATNSAGIAPDRKA